MINPMTILHPTVTLIRMLLFQKRAIPRAAEPMAYLQRSITPLRALSNTERTTRALQGRRWNFESGGFKVVGGLGDGVPQWGPGAKPR